MTTLVSGKASLDLSSQGINGNINGNNRATSLRFRVISLRDHVDAHYR